MSLQLCFSYRHIIGCPCFRMPIYTGWQSTVRNGSFASSLWDCAVTSCEAQGVTRQLAFIESSLSPYQHGLGSLDFPCQVLSNSHTYAVVINASIHILLCWCFLPFHLPLLPQLLWPFSSTWKTLWISCLLGPSWLTRWWQPAYWYWGMDVEVASHRQKPTLCSWMPSLFL